jgi:hypothetical protein
METNHFQEPAPQDIASTVRSRPGEELVKTVKAELLLPDPPSHVVAKLLQEDDEPAEESPRGPA